jgi:DNA-binding XRE family transcriptional regulator
LARTKSRITKPVDFAPLGRKLAELRRGAKLTQWTVAHNTGISASQIGRIEMGVGLDRLSFEDVVRLCQFYGISPTQAAEIMGLWPVPEIATLEADLRINATISYISSMPKERRDMFVEMIYQAASALSWEYDIPEGLNPDESTNIDIC